jgi:hypothetical protein
MGEEVELCANLFATIVNDNSSEKKLLIGSATMDGELNLDSEVELEFTQLPRTAKPHQHPSPKGKMADRSHSVRMEAQT